MCAADRASLRPSVPEQPAPGPRLTPMLLESYAVVRLRSGPGSGATASLQGMTAFSDFPVPSDHELHPFAEQIHAYLRAYADGFGVTQRIQLRRRIGLVRPGWIVDGERFDAVVVASGDSARRGSHPAWPA